MIEDLTTQLKDQEEKLRLIERDHDQLKKKLQTVLKKPDIKKYLAIMEDQGQKKEEQKKKENGKQQNLEQSDQ